MRKRTIITLTALTFVLGAAGCGLQDEMNDDRGRGDAPVGDKDDSKKNVINFPNDFSNVAHACDGHGHRIFVSTQNANGKEMEVIDDPSCGNNGE